MKILLVDDEADIVTSLLALLEKVPGHEIRSATTGGQALQAAMAMGGVDLLITDVVMEPMDGFTLRDQVATRYPGARTIFISGYDLSDYAEQTAGHQILAKPVDQAELIAAITGESPAGEVPVTETEPESVPAAAAEPEPVAEATPEPEPIAEVAPEPEPVAEATPEPEPVVEATPEPEPVAEAAPEPEPEPPVPAVPVPVKVAARPVAVPQPATPRPVAVPAVPVAVKATPAAVPVAVKATPSAVPVARPVVQPTATARAVSPQQPTAVPKPAVAAAPVAVPKVAAAPAVAVRATAAPAAPSVPTPTVKAAPTVKAVAAPQATAVPQPVAAPKVAAAAPKAVAAVPKPAVPTAAPVAAKPAAVAVKPVAAAPAAPKVAAAGPKAVSAPKVGGAPAAVPKTPAAPPAPAMPDDELVGQTIGAYQIQRVLGDGRWGRAYGALQTSINRQVGLKILAPEQASDETARTRFLGDARAKAHVQHPSILAVYEAGEANGHVFYTHEFVEGRNLAQIQASGERLDEPTALRVLKSAAEGLNYLNANRLPHGTPTATSIYLGIDGTPRLANLATNAGDEQVPVEQEIQALGRLMLSVLPSIQAVSQGFRTLLSRMVQAGPQAVSSWGALVQAIKALEPKVIPVEAAKISAQDRAAIAAVESARKSQKRSLYINVGSMISLVLVAAIVVWRFFSTNERNLDVQIEIPAGSFTFGTAQAETGAYSIDKYEVSIGQYAKFVQFLEGHPTSEYDHERQPRIKTADMHKPKDWAIYYGRAKQGQAIHSVPSDLNMPALMIDWWDAYAYAKWKGRELPTEQEWEKAARGTQGFIYPWGNDFDPKKVNSNADFVPTDPAAKGKVDGFNHWGPVDEQRDKSPTGTLGMAGNVAEWTATWTKDNKFPIIKGGSYMSSDVRLDKRIDNVPAHTAQENLGFRTVSRKK